MSERTTMSGKKKFLLAVGAVVLPALIAVGLARAADIVVGKQAPESERVGYDQISHAAWDGLLRQFVNDRGEVDYRAWKDSAESMRLLDDYLNHLSSLDPDREAKRESELAFWINAYNAVTVKGILREYPTTSIRNHANSVWGYNIWKNLKLRFADSQINLDDIEHKLLRKKNEPRIHFAIVCASIGCPRLLNEAYDPGRLDEQLTANARDFFAQERNFRANADNNRVYLSSILKWFGKDFGGDQAAVLEAVSPFLPDDAARELVAKPGVRVSYLEYDWGINEQK